MRRETTTGFIAVITDNIARAICLYSLIARTDVLDAQPRREALETFSRVETLARDLPVDDPCIVCLDQLSSGERVRRLRCEHVFHAECIDRWFEKNRRNACPICATPLALLPQHAQQIRPTWLREHRRAHGFLD